MAEKADLTIEQKSCCNLLEILIVSCDVAENANQELQKSTRVRKSAALGSSPPGSSLGAINASGGGGAFCGDPGRPKNGRSLYASQHEHAIVTHSCDPGHVLVGAGRRVCQQNGMWTPNLPKCLCMLDLCVCVCV